MAEPEVKKDDEKKRPGRPRKKHHGFSIPYSGIITSMQSESIVNIVYDNPIMFKKILTIYKTYSVDKIYVKFEPTLTKMYAVDGIEKNGIYVEILGDKMNKYYCKSTVDTEIDHDVYTRILAEITKDCSCIELNMTTPTQLNVITKNTEYAIDTHSEFNVRENAEYDWAIENTIANIDDYNISFELPAKVLKMKITNLKPYAEVLEIEKNGTNPLKFNVEYKDHCGTNRTYFMCEDKIKMRSNVGEGDLFGVSVNLEHIKSIASASIADTITIYADKMNDLVFGFILDLDELPSEGRRSKVRESERARVYVTTKIIKTASGL